MQGTRAAARRRALARSRSQGVFSSVESFSDASDFTAGAMGTSIANGYPQTLPRGLTHQSSVQQELERARYGNSPRSLFPELREVWRGASPARLARLSLPIGIRRSARSRPFSLTERARPGRAVVISRRHKDPLLQAPFSGKVSVCLSRRARREVLFAFGVGGSRGLGKRGVRRTFNSQWRC